jgi:uncharacterized repeat protein (TIGR03803 family)
MSAGALYGTSYNGGAFGKGTVFRLNADGTSYAVLKHFNDLDGSSPFAALVASGSRLYGTTQTGGDYGLGTVFYLDLAPQLACARQDDGRVSVAVTGEVGRRCELYASSNLMAWNLVTTMTNQTGTLVYVDDQATNALNRFYRARQLP